VRAATRPERADGRSTLASTPVDAAFEAAAAPLLADPSVARGRRQLCREVRAKAFAMVSGGRIVVKLPRARVEELVAEGAGAPFRLGARTMAEWVVLRPDSRADAAALAAEARRFVGG
jgi:hypothetical protein